MNNLGKFIKNRRNELNLTLGQVEYKSGIPKSTFQRIEAGNKKRINPEYLKKISYALEVNIIKLFELSGYISEEDLTEYYAPILSKSIESQLKLMKASDVSLFPVYTSISEGCFLSQSSEPDHYISLNESHLNSVGLIISDDSMSPTILDEAIIILKKENEVKNGEIGVFILNNEALVRRIIYTKDSIFLYSDNTNYLPILIKNDDNFIILGKVIKTLNSL